MCFSQKKRRKIWRVIKLLYLCSVKLKDAHKSNKLGYGVMVTQQILVLFFLVRIRVAQQINEEFDVSDSFFVYSQCYSFDSHPVFLGF